MDGPASQAGRKRALLHTAVSYSPGKGGEADVEKEAHAAAAGPRTRGAGDDSTYHKSVLTARLVPRQSAKFAVLTSEG